MLFKTFCSAIYCNSLWCTYTDKIMNRFKIAYNNTFRKLFGLSFDCSASTMFAQHNVPAFVHVRRKAMYSLTERIARANNEILLRLTAVGLSHDNKSIFWHVRDHLLFIGHVCRCAGCSVQ